MRNHQKIKKMSIVEKFTDDEIFPYILDTVEDLKEAKVSYPSGLQATGVELTPTNVKDEPAVDWDAEEGSFYTLLLTGELDLMIY